jgi:hypothetical protein
MRSPCCLCVCEAVVMKLSMYVMIPEPISIAYFINSSRQSVCIPPIVARQRLGKRVIAATKKYWRRRFQRGPCRIKKR